MTTIPEEGTEMISPAVGQRVSYEDMANPRRYGKVVGITNTYGHNEFGVAWEDDGEITSSDLRQTGWKVEPDKCRDCDGTGEKVLNPDWPSGDQPHSEKCATCSGMGTVEAPTFVYRGGAAR